MIAKLNTLFIIVIAASITGFITENLWCSIRHGYIDNRGMQLPALLGYGIAIAGLFLLFGTPEAPRFFTLDLRFLAEKYSYPYYLLMAFLSVSIGEIALGNIVERTCGIVWWNYESLPMHIGKYTSVPTSLGFAFLIVLFMKFVFTPFYNWSIDIESTGFFITSSFNVLLLVVDYIHSAIYMKKNKKIYISWRKTFSRRLPIVRPLS